MTESTVSPSKKEHFVYQPDLDEICRLMANTWARPCWEYSPDLIRSYLGKPGDNSSLSLGLYFDKEMAGYLAYIPIVVSYHSQRHPMLYATWWTASRKYSGQGIGTKLHKELLGVSRKKGYKGLLTVTHADSHADKANHRTYACLGESFNLLYTFSQMMTTPQIARRRLSSVDAGEVNRYEPSLCGECLSVLNASAGRVDVVQIIQENEADYILKDRPIVHTWLFKKEQCVKAVISVVEKKYLGENSTVNAYIEHIAFDGLTGSECLQFWKGILKDSYWDKIDTICIPEIHQVSSDLLLQMGFCRSIKKFNLYHIPFDDKMHIENISSFDLPVY